jgi:6-phosphogluconolactonase
MRIKTVAMLLLFGGPAMAANQLTVWIGMGSPRFGEKEGIYRATLNADTGDITPPVLAAEIKSPEFLAVRPDGKRLYAVCQLSNRQPGVASFSISDGGATLRPLNTEPIGDGGACFVATDHTGRCLFTAQYGNGSVASFPLGDDGRVMKRGALVKHSGSGPNKSRQEAPHPHSAFVDPTNRFVMVPDLGTDQIVIYKFDPGTGELQAHGHGKTPAGAGPRHMKFHPNGRFAYVVNELTLSVTAFDYDAQKGTLTALQTISTLPDNQREVMSSCSEIRIHPSGKFLYAANRGHDSIAAFAIDQDTGRLTSIDREAIRGSHPRNFNVDPTGKWLLVAGRDSNTVSVFKIGDPTGGLVFSGRIVNSPSPICIEFQPRS